MTRPTVVALLLLTAAMAGCVGGSEDSGSDADAASTPGTETLEDGNATDNATGPGHEDVASLAEPPQWSPGSFWELQLENGQTGGTTTVTRVVADRVGDTYRVGMPANSFSHPAVVSHFPGWGNVAVDDLGFTVHDERFKPLDFPLQEGKTWTTTLYQQDFEAEVTETTDAQATIVMTSEDNATVELTYDADTEAITELTGPLDLSLSVSSHGHGYEGEVKVPYDRSQFIDGRFVGAINFAFEPAPPTGSVTVDAGYDEASVAQLIGSFPIFGVASPGVYREVATDPEGETIESQTTGHFTYAYGSSTSPSGEWSFEHVAGGAGVAATEIIAYKTQTVQLPQDTTSS